MVRRLSAVVCAFTLCAGLVFAAPLDSADAHAMQLENPRARVRDAAVDLGNLTGLDARDARLVQLSIEQLNLADADRYWTAEDRVLDLSTGLVAMANMRAAVRYLDQTREREIDNLDSDVFDAMRQLGEANVILATLSNGNPYLIEIAEAAADEGVGWWAYGDLAFASSFYYVAWNLAQLAILYPSA